MSKFVTVSNLSNPLKETKTLKSTDFFFYTVLKCSDTSVKVGTKSGQDFTVKKMGNILPNILPNVGQLVNPPICWVMFCPKLLVK